MMVGEACPLRGRDTCFGEGAEEFLRIGDAGEGENAPAAQRRDCGGVRFEPGMENRQAAADRAFRHRGGAVRGADDHHGIGFRHLRVERRPQRPCRKRSAVADAAAAIDHHDREVLGERRVLEAVVHHDHGRAGLLRCFGAGQPVARDDGGCKLCQQQRLVADVGRGVLRRIDQHRPGDASAITAGQKERPLICGEQQPRH